MLIFNIKTDKDNGPYDFPFVKTFINGSLSK
jgi:hypothetical protein